MATRATIDHPESTGRDGAIDHMTKLLDGARGSSIGRRLHAGPHGDAWYLISDAMGPAVVRVPNVAPGSQVERVTVATFLTNGDGPAQQELLRLIGMLTDPD